MNSDTIQTVDFGHQKEILEMRNLEQIDGIYKFNNDVFVYTRKTGIWKKDELYHGAKKSIVFLTKFHHKRFLFDV